MKKTIKRTYRKKTQAEGNSFASSIYKRMNEDGAFVTEQALVTHLKVVVSWKKDPDAVNYGILYQVAGETVWQNGTTSTRVSTLITGLPSGKYVTFKVYSMGRNGLKSDETEAVTVLIS